MTEETGATADPRCDQFGGVDTAAEANLVWKDIHTLTYSFDASEINNWADKADAEHKLPALIRCLVLATLPDDPPLRIDFPGGSSVRLSGWDGLLEVEHGNAWAPSGVSGWEFSCNKKVTKKADEDYNKRTADPLGLDKTTATFVFATARRWGGKREWLEKRRNEGQWHDVRAYDADDLVAWLEQSREVSQWFAGVINRQPFDYQSLQRFEDLQEKTKDQVSAGFVEMKEMKTEIRSLTASLASQAKQPDSEPAQDPQEQKISEKLDAARDLIQHGLTAEARTELEGIEREEEHLSDALKFRLLTNLAACAVGEGRNDEACPLFNEAHSIQPENPTGIINASLAAELQQDFDRAVNLARRALSLDPSDPSAAANLISSLGRLGESEQLENFVESADWVTGETPSALALARVRVQQGLYDDAAAVYRTLIEADPNEAFAHLGLSECLIDQSQLDRLPVAYSQEDLERIREAEKEADRAIDILKPTQLEAQRQDGFILRARARSLLGKVDEGMRDVDRVLDEDSEHPGATFLKGLLLLEKGLASEARRWIESISDPEVLTELLLPLADACLETGDEMAAIRLLSGNFKLDPPGKEDFARAQSLMRAEAAAGADDTVGPQIDAAIEQFPSDPYLFALAAVRSDRKRDTEGTEAALMKAVDLASGPFRQELRGQLGRHYERMDRFAEAAEQFGKACGGEANHPDALPMLLSLSNSKQYRKALALSQRIRELSDPLPRVVIELEAQIVGYVGDVKAALERIRELCSREDSVAHDRVKLAQALFRGGDRDAAMKTVDSINVSRLGQDSQALMGLAHLKHSLGASDYIQDAYLARRYGFDDPDAHLGYSSLFLTVGDAWEEPVVVGPGCAVCLKDGEREQWWHILEDGEDPSGTQELSLGNGLAKLLLGRSVGDVVVLPQSVGKVSCEIAELQSKYVRAFQETLQDFSMLFPGNMSLSRVEMDSNFTQFFQSIDSRHEYVGNVQELYNSGQIPFASFCSFIGHSILTAWPGYIAQPASRLHFGAGTDEETKEAGDLLLKADTVVLDMVALLTVHRLGLAEHLQKRFARVTIPQLMFDEIQNTVCRMRGGPNPSGHVGKNEEDRYTPTEMSEDDWKERQAYARSVLELADTFERIPSYALLDRDDPQESIEVLTQAGAGAVFAREEGSTVQPLLVSDDLPLASVARSVGLKAVNSQAVLVALLRSDVITAEEYSSKIEELVKMNYWSVRLSSSDILRRLEANGFQTTPGIQAMLSRLAGPDCTEEAAATVGADVVAALAMRSLIPQQLDLLLSLVLEALRRGRHTNQVLLRFRDEVAARLALAPLQRAQVLEAVDIRAQL